MYQAAYNGYGNIVRILMSIFNRAARNRECSSPSTCQTLVSQSRVSVSHPSHDPASEPGPSVIMIAAYLLRFKIPACIQTIRFNTEAAGAATRRLGLVTRTPGPAFGGRGGHCD